MTIEINAENQHFKDLNEQIRLAKEDTIILNNCLGQRYIGSGHSSKKIIINGIPGNSLGAYLNGSHIIVKGNAQDATGDTMNDGKIFIHGHAGDATGYAMRGGNIFVKGNTGYRAGIHMKAYKDKTPVLVIGGVAGSFLGEYQAGGIIIVLGLYNKHKIPAGYFCGTGMHGGKIYLRCKSTPNDLPNQVVANDATTNDMDSISCYLDEFCDEFEYSKNEIYNNRFVVLTPNTKSPYKQMYQQLA